MYRGARLLPARVTVFLDFTVPRMAQFLAATRAKPSTVSR